MLLVKLPALEDLDREDIERLKHLETMMGELPANALLFTQIPGLPQAVFDLSQAILIPGDVGMELKWLVGHMSSRVAGCQFCTAHTAYNAAQSALHCVWPQRLALFLMPLISRILMSCTNISTINKFWN